VHVPDARACTVRREPGRKPRLAHGHLDYSVTHSGTRVAVVLAAGGRVGADLQRVEPRWDVRALADRVLTAREVSWMSRRASGSDQHAFAEAWARKEALAKLLGDGITATTVRLDASRPSSASIGSAVHGDWAAAVAWEREVVAAGAGAVELQDRDGVDDLVTVAASAVAEGA
jgi:4'-phosphopantetheinyl transferase